MSSKAGMRVTSGIVIGLALAWQPAMCQHGGAGGGAGAGGGGAAGGGTAGRTSPMTTTGRTTQPTTPGDVLNRGLFLSGKVQMDDGTAPPEPVVIERVCNGYTRAEAYTDSKGRFSFQLGQNLGVAQDASFDDTGAEPQGSRTSRNPTSAGQDSLGASRRTSPEYALAGCEIRADLPGYRSDVVNLAGRRIFDNPEVGTLILHRMANVEGTTISATTLAAPKDARKAYDKAREALRKGKTDEAEKNLDKAVTAYPQFAAAWTELGVIREKGNHVAEARNCFSKALAADPKLVTPYLHLTQFSINDKNWQDAADTSSRVIKLDPYDFPEAYFYNSVAGFHLGKLDEAEASAREAQKLDTAHRFPKVDHILGVILYEKKNYAGAAEQMRNYLKLAPDAPDATLVKQQLGEIEKLLGSETKAKADTPQP